MWHIYKNKQNKFEFAFIRKGRYIAGTKQGYNRMSTAIESLVSCREVVAGYFEVQDDTGEKPVIVRITIIEGRIITEDIDLKTSKVYKA